MIKRKGRVSRATSLITISYKTSNFIFRIDYCLPKKSVRAGGNLKKRKVFLTDRKSPLFARKFYGGNIDKTRWNRQYVLIKRKTTEKPQRLFPSSASTIRDIPPGSDEWDPPYKGRDSLRKWR